MTARAPRILVVDDDPIFRAIVAEVLADVTSDLVEAEDGEQAVRMLRAAPADLVVTDIHMPNRDGIELIGDIRRDWPRTAIIAVSAGSSVSSPDLVLRTAKLLGAHIIEKPVTAKSLRDLVDQALGAAATKSA